MFLSVAYLYLLNLQALNVMQMITIGAMLGIGFYVRIGTVLRTAGPLAVLLSFTLLTLLGWGVMQCITEMLSIWPIPGALVEFVGCFIDKELGYTMGIAYWLVVSEYLGAHQSSFSA